MRWPLIALALAACGDDLPTPFADPVLVEVATFPAVPARELDLLFVIDDSNGGPETQAKLAARGGALFERLGALPAGMPDLHLGVTSTDLGTMGSADPMNPGPTIGSVGQGGCEGSGKDGRLLTSGAQVTGTFLVDEADGAGGRTRNYVGALGDVFTQMIQLGAGGCGFEQPFHALRRALSNPLNQAFSRPDAHLAVVFLTDEDDCSFRDAQLVTTDTSSLGTLASFRCTRQGITCAETLDEPGAKTACHADEQSTLVEAPQDTAAFLADFTSDRARFSVGAIAGAPLSVTVELRPPPGGGVGVLALQHTCTSIGPIGPSYADPGVRIHDLVTALGSQGAFGSICSDDFTPQLQSIARVITPAFGVTCLDTTRLADASTEPGVQPTCELTLDHAGEVTPLPACPSDGDCYDLVADAAACPDTADHLRLVTRWATTAPANTYVRARCEPWPPG